MRKLKIGITCYPTVGGSGVIATELGKLLAEKGHEIHFISSSVPFRLNKMYPNVFFHEVSVNNYAVFQYPPYDIALASKMADVIQDEGLDVLHVHYAIPHAVCAVLARGMSKRDIGIVTTLHGTDISVLGQDSNLARAIQYGIDESDIVTTVSNSLKQQTYELINTKKAIETVYNFVDEQEYHRVETGNLKAQFGIKDNERVIIHVSNFRKIKRVEDVIATFMRVREKMPAKLLLVGDGPEKQRITDCVRTYEHESDVLFLGKQESLTELYAISDVKLLLSEKESFGLVLLEAMACGVPCVGTAIGGIPEVIEDGVDGYIVPLGDVELAAKRVMQLVEDDKKHQAFCEAAVQSVYNNFHSSKIVAEYEALYYEVVSRYEQ